MEEEILFDADEIENVSEEDMEELEELVNEYQDEIIEHGDRLTHLLGRINNTKVYQELGIHITVDTEYYYSHEELEE